MTSQYEQAPSCWCIVVADDQSADCAPFNHSGPRHAPVQYSRLGGTASLLQKALQRAAKMVPDSQVVVTALEEYRALWEPTTWFIPPGNKFVGDNRAASLLTTSAALLWIASQDPANIVTILPARCHVESESTLHAALTRAVALLPQVDEGVVTLGMMDLFEGVDEDYLIARRSKCGPGFDIQGFARRPIPWVARHLRDQGAMVASGIVVGYAGAFAAHISKQWPGISRHLLNIADDASAAGTECEVSSDLQRGIPSPVLTSLNWRFPTLAQRAFQVSRCGWSSLKSAQAVERITQFIAKTLERREEQESPSHSVLSTIPDTRRWQYG